MSETAGEKTEEPTAKKLKDGRKRGQVAQSQDVNKLFITVAGFNVVFSLYEYFLEKINEHINLTFSMLNEEIHTALQATFTKGYLTWAAIVLPILLVVCISRILAGFLQYGVLFAPESLKLDLNKINPVKNAKNIISKKKLVEFIGNIVKATVLFIVWYFVTKNNISDILNVPMSSVKTGVIIGISVFQELVNYSMGIFLVVAVTDYILQKNIFIKSMKMTKDEVSREYKQSEGDPALKQERKSRGRELVMKDDGGVSKKVEKSNVVVVNPTHYAVAIAYEAGITPLPILKAKGVEKRADQIIGYARDHGIPVVRYVSLARSIYRVCDEEGYVKRECLKRLASVFVLLKKTECELGGKIEIDLEIRDVY